MVKYEIKWKLHTNPDLQGSILQKGSYSHSRLVEMDGADSSLVVFA